MARSIHFSARYRRKKAVCIAVVSSGIDDNSRKIGLGASQDGQFPGIIRFMKAAPFEYARPATLAEACGLLAAHGPDAKLIAGGQSLVPMMAMRLARPAWLIDISRLAELQRIAVPADLPADGDGVFAVGAGVRQCVMERDPHARASVPLLARALRWVGHVQTRNRGTIGGSIVHGDASAEIAPVSYTHLRAHETRHDLVCRL